MAKVSLELTRNLLEGSKIKNVKSQISRYKNGKQVTPHYGSTLSCLGVSGIYTDKLNGKRFLSVTLKDGRVASFYDAMSKEGSEKLNKFFEALEIILKSTF